MTWKSEGLEKGMLVTGFMSEDWKGIYSRLEFSSCVGDYAEYYI